MCVDREERYANAEEFREALERVKQEVHLQKQCMYVKRRSLNMHRENKSTEDAAQISTNTYRKTENKQSSQSQMKAETRRDSDYAKTIRKDRYQ